MNKSALTIVGIVAVGLLILYGFRANSTGSATAGEKSIVWADPGIAKEAVASGGKPVFLFVETDWCTFCKKMKVETFADADVQKQLNDRFVNIHINPEKAGVVRFTGEELTFSGLAEKLRVTGYPATFFFTADGQLLGGQPGYIDPATFADLTSYIGGGYYTKYKFPEFQSLPKDQRM